MERKQSRRQFLKDMGILGIGALLPNLPRTELSDNGKEWEQFQVGDQVFISAKGPCDLYSKPNIKAPKVINRVEDTYTDTSNILWSPRYQIMHETTFRVALVEDEEGKKWGEIKKEEDKYTPFMSPDTSGYQPENLYVNLDDFEPIPQLIPISVLSDTKPTDKDIVIVRVPSPQMFLVEQDEVVAHIPVILGSYKTPTPNGDFRVSAGRLSKFMPSFTGVGYNLLIEETSGIFIHNAAWWKWAELQKGRYGSHGCVNLPDDRWINASIVGEDVSMARFVFQWGLTNLPDYDQKKTEYVKVSPKDPAADKLLEVHIMNTLEGLNWTKRADPKRNWDKIALQAKGLGETQWIIPKSN